MNVWVVAIVFIVASIYLYIRQKNTQEEEYERVAGTFIEMGASVPEWVVKETWKLIAKVPINRGGHPNKPKRNILFCESIVLTGSPRYIALEAVPVQRTPQDGETFNISKTGELEFDRQPNL